MKTPPDIVKPAPLAKGARPVLRLVRSAPPAASPAAPDAAPASDAAPSPRPRSRVARFLEAYADAIDRDVKLILEV